MNVLIISASMGAGHDGAARELQRRLERDGHDAEVVDYLSAFPFGLGRVVRLSYQWELRLAPWSYEATYRLWYLLPSMAGPLVTLLALFTRRRVSRWVADHHADAVVSTYPLASLTLGRMRKRHQLDVPVSTFITDFAVHPLWAAPGVDLHLAVHPLSARSAHQQTGAAAAAPGPLVPQRFTSDRPSRAAARAKLGIDADAKVVLLVAGSWGVGAVRRTFDDVLASEGWLPLAVCGRNERLRRGLASRGRGWVVGWTNEMPVLMAAADVLVENAGGLTCMEAFAAGLPVVSYRPIAGHGKGNAREMEAAGVAALAQPGTLRRVLDDTLGLDGERRRRAGKAMFAGDAAADIVSLAEAGVASPDIAHIRTARWRRPAVAAATAVASLVLGVGLASAGAGIAAAHGVAVAHPPKHATAVYLAVRLGPQVASDPRIPAALAGAGVTAIVSGQLAASEPQFVADLAAAGCDVANGGWGTHRGVQWTWAHADVERSTREIDEATGDRVRTFVPGPHIDGFALASAAWDDQRVVLSRETVPLTSERLPDLRPGRIYVFDARALPATGILTVLSEIESLRAAGQQVAPLSSLKG